MKNRINPILKKKPGILQKTHNSKFEKETRNSPNPLNTKFDIVENKNRIIQNLKSNIDGFNHQREFQQLVWNIAQIQGKSVFGGNIINKYCFEKIFSTASGALGVVPFSDISL